MLSLRMLKTARRLYGYTQDELAQKVGKAQRYYTQIENGSSKSAPLISKLSALLKLRESYLGSRDEYEYVDYPFLADFYQFCIADKDLGDMYDKIVKDICSKSAFVDVTFLLVNPSLIGVKMGPGGYPVLYIAIRDDRETVFLIKKKEKGSFSVGGVRVSYDVESTYSLDETGKLTDRRLEHRIFSKLDTFRDMLQSMRSTYVYETTKMLSEELYHRIEDGSVSREDIAKLFPGIDYFEGMYQAHNRIKKR